MLETGLNEKKKKMKAILCVYDTSIETDESVNHLI